MIQHYFPNRDSVFLTLHTIGDDMTDSFMWIFVGVILSSYGMPLHFVLLFFGLEFGLRGIFHPFSIPLANRFGIVQTILLSYAPLLVFFALLLMLQHSLFLSFFSFGFYSLSRGLNYPLLGGLYSEIVPDSHRGRHRSFVLIVQAICSICMVAIGSWALAAQNHTVIFLLMCGIIVLSALPLFFFRNIPQLESESVGEIYRYLFSSEYRAQWPLAIGYQFIIISSLVATPLFIFQIIGDFTAYGLIFGAAIITEVLFILLFGHYIDKKGYKRSMMISGFFHGIGSIALMLIAGPISAFFLETHQRISFKIFQNSIEGSIDEEALRSKRPFLFQTALNMALCFPEVLILGLLSLFAYFFGELVFFVIFSSAVLGIWMSIRSLQNKA